ncbi:hypothetical protein DSO57_1007854 [Entomophthora muscae]|uniref:Uncharacterized protein n=1 Tax=Entomophthora muscae TaxID=34485 RepID=A0ACC2TUY1_9FUNG|nr:hypothetical protein DSO57_1007854 [Entomophthora muscae]
MYEIKIIYTYNIWCSWKSSNKHLVLLTPAIPSWQREGCLVAIITPTKDLPSDLAQIQKFIDDVPQPSQFGNQSPLLFTAPTPMEVDANASPSKEAIKQSMTRMDKGADKKDQQSQMLAIQNPSVEISMERFCNISMNLQTAEHVKDYIQHFSHPFICHI